MLTTRIDTRGLNPAFLEQYERKLRRDHQNAVKQRADFVVVEAKALAPVDTGALQGSIESVPIADGFFVGSKIRYAGWQEYGTKKIAPVAYLRRAVAKMLITFSKSVGK